jgi:hypothetical protein
VGAAEELRHHRPRRDAAGERKALAPIAGDEVGGLKRHHRTDRRRLLPGGEVAVAADPRRLVLTLRRFLEATDQEHHPIALVKVAGVEVVGAADESMVAI